MTEMTRTLTALCAALLLPILPASAQTAELISIRSLDQIQGLANTLGIPDGVLPLDFDVAKYRVTYPMDYIGSTYDVTGAVYIPVDGEGNALACALPTHTYMHGTIFVRSDAPSYQGFEGELGYLMATGGMLTLLPDYLGLGGSEDVLHPYVHAASEAESGMALLAAAEALGDDLGFSLNGEHFVSGYSQGGHAAMAMAKRMQEDEGAGFPLAAAAPMSGPYDMSGTQLPMGMAQEQYSNPAYLAYILLAWQQTYGNIFVELSEIFQEPFASGLPGMFDGETTGEVINDFLAGPTEDIIQAGALEAMMDESSAFFAAAQDNDLYQWVPESPVQMYYCTLDEQVFHENALLTDSWMNDNGAASVTSVNGGPLNHGGCALLAILGGTVWLNGQANLCTPSSVQPERRSKGLTWHPTHTGVVVEGLEPGQHWTLFAMDGRLIDRGVSKSDRLGLQVEAGLSMLVAEDGRFVRMLRH